MALLWRISCALVLFATLAACGGRHIDKDRRRELWESDDVGESPRFFVELGREERVFRFFFSTLQGATFSSRFYVLRDGSVKAVADGGALGRAVCREGTLDRCRSWKMELRFTARREAESEQDVVLDVDWVTREDYELFGRFDVGPESSWGRGTHEVLTFTSGTRVRIAHRLSFVRPEDGALRFGEPALLVGEVTRDGREEKAFSFVPVLPVVTSAGEPIAVALGEALLQRVGPFGDGASRVAALREFTLGYLNITTEKRGRLHLRMAVAR